MFTYTIIPKLPMFVINNNNTLQLKYFQKPCELFPAFEINKAKDFLKQIGLPSCNKNPPEPSTVMSFLGAVEVRTGWN